ncbi:MAG TPA: CRTAC1 family protein, partial [Candidatus Thermoplasmatota archaeon]|nr:CRTAC1 family protein [Candidatus Thermoplasmatota archaeon]
LLVTNFGPPQLFRGHCDGTFADVSAAALGSVAQEGSCGDAPCFGSGSAWADFDNDGDLDAYVGNYVESSTTDTIRGPNGHIAQHNFLLRNNGDGTFSDVAGAAGCAGSATDADGSKTLGVGWFDYDLDGDMDIFAANDQTADNLYRNEGDGTFTERAAPAGVADERAGMGLAIGDYDNDGYPDLFFTHYATQDNGFYRNLHDGTFEDRSGEDDLHNSFMNVGWGDRFADIDRDGDLDIVLANGHTEWIDPDRYAQPMQVFRNDPEPEGAAPGDRRWTDISADAGAGIAEERVHRGLAASDMDYDGDVDLALVNNANDTAQLMQGAGVENNWLYLQLRQPGANPSAVGARVKVEAAGLDPQWREVQAGGSYLSQHALLLDLGLGAATQADKVTVYWPASALTTTVVLDVPAGRVARIDRATGSFVLDTLSPLTSAALAGVGQEGWFRGDVAVSASAVDRAVGGTASGVALTQARVDGAAWATYAGPLTVAGEGVHTLQARSRDAVGNQEPPRTTVVRIDLTPPLPSYALDGALGNEGWYTSAAVAITLTGEDELSGPGAIRYRVDGGEWQDYEAPFDVTEDGAHTVAFVAADLAGNEAAEASFEVRLDHTGPDVLVLRPAPGSVYVDGVEVLALPRAGGLPAVVVATPGALRFDVAASAIDAASGLARLELWFDGARVAAGESSPAAWAWPAGASPAGLHYVEAVAADAAGNVNAASVRVLLLPATPEGAAATLAEGPSLVTGPLPAQPEAAPARRDALPGL